MCSVALHVEMERKRWKEGVEGAFIPPHIEYSRYSFNTRNIRGKLGNSEKSGDSGVNQDTLASQGQHPRKVSRGRAGAKVSLIGFIIATRAPVRLLEDTFPVPSLSTVFLGLKFKNIKCISLLRSLL
jgi:hypothetical protein